MGEPARKIDWEGDEPDDESTGVVLLQRWVERPDGSLELMERPLTPEDFLDPQLEDKWMQGRPHSRVRRYFAEILERHFAGQDDVMILEDVKHLFPGLPGPGPDVSVIRGSRFPGLVEESFDAAEQEVVPCLIIEVVSPFDARIRRTDQVDKVALYQQAGVPEYLLVDLPRRANRHRFQIKGYRLGSPGLYQPIAPDEQGCILSMTTGIRFGVSLQGAWIDLFDAATGERLLAPLELEAARKAAEERAAQEAKARQVAEAAQKAAEAAAAREAKARQAAEAELARLRAEIERLKQG